MFKPDEFVVGGTVQAGDGVYIEREADQELLVLCRTRAFVYILSTRQVGKSSLIINVAKSLANEGIAPVIIDLQESGVHDLTADTWYIGFLTEVADQLTLDVDVESWWNERVNLPHGKRFTTFFKEIVLEQNEGPVVVFVDEIDTTRSLPFADDFYTAIRSIYNSRAIVPEFQRLSFVLVGAAAPTDLIRDTKRTPFNIGQRVELTDFTYNETFPLATRLALPESTSRQITNDVLGWTSGHPYLTLALFRKIAEAVKAGKKDWTAQDIDAIVAENFFGGQEDSNLRFVRDMLTIHAPDSERVLNTYRDIYREKAPVVDEERSPIKAHLKLAGVVRSENGDLHVRNRIYREIYDEDWIRKHLPVNWTRRLQRAASVAVALFFIALLPLSIFAWWQKQKAENALVAESVARQEAVRLAESEQTARKEAELSATNEKLARSKAEEAERLEASARKKAEQSATSEREARIEATASAERARQAMLLAEERRLIAERAVFKEQEATKAALKAGEEARKAEAEARKAEEEARKAKEQADAKGQVAFAQQLVIRAEAELEKNDTASASAFFANALLLDDQEDTRSRLLTTLLQVARPFWTTPASLETPGVFGISGDGNLLATLIDNREIAISDTQTGTIKHRISGYEGYGSRMVLDSTGETLVTANQEISLETAPDPTNPGRRLPVYDSSFTTYDVASGRVLHETKYQTTAQTYAISPNGKLALVRALDGKIQVLNVETGNPQVLPTSIGAFDGFAFSPNGQLLAAVKDDELFLWDLQKIASVRTMKDAATTSEMNNDRARIAFSPDGKQIVWYREPLNVPPPGTTAPVVAAVLTVWDVARGKPVARLTPNEPVLNFAFGANSKDVVLMIYNGKVLRWIVDDGQTVEVVSPELSPIPFAGGLFSSDGRKFVTRGAPREFQIYNVDGMKLAGTVSIKSKHVGHSDNVTAVAFDPKGEFVASGGTDSRLILWSAETGKMVRTLSEDVSIRALAFSFDGRWLAYTGNSTVNIYLWNRETDERRVLPTTVTINSLAFSPTESLLAAGTVNGELLMWTPEQGSTTQAIAPEPSASPTPGAGTVADSYRRAVISIDFSNDGKKLAALRNDEQGVVRFYNVQTRKPLYTFRSSNECHGGDEFYTSLTFGDNGIFATASINGSVRVWRIVSGTETSMVIQEVQVLPAKFGTQTRLAFSPDAQRLAVASGPGGASSQSGAQYSVRVWDVKAQQWLTSVRGGFDALAVQFSRDGRFLAAGATDAKVRLWEVKDTLPFSAMERSDVSALSKDGELVAGVERDGAGASFVVRSLKDGQFRQKLEIEFFSSPLSEFSPDKKWLVASSSTPKGNSVRVWDLPTAKVVREIPSDGADISDIEFSLDSRFMVVAFRSNLEKGSAVGKNKAVVYELQSGKTRDVPFMAGSLWSVAISPDGKYLLMGGGGERPSDTKQKSVVVWNLETDQQSFTWTGKSGAVLSLAFSAEQGKDRNEWVFATGEGNGDTNPTDETMRLIDFQTQKQLRTFPGFTETVLGVSFTPRSSTYNILISAGLSHRAWNLERSPGSLETGLKLSGDSVSMRPTLSTSGRFLMAASRGQVKTWDMNQVTLLMNSRPEEIVSYVTNFTQLNVLGLDELGFARLSQEQLKTLLGTSFRSNFTVVQTQTSSGPGESMK